jgi:hypothetical protein
MQGVAMFHVILLLSNIFETLKCNISSNGVPFRNGSSGKYSFLLSIYDSNKSIDFVHGKSKYFYWSSGRIRSIKKWFLTKKIFFLEILQTGHWMDGDGESF